MAQVGHLTEAIIASPPDQIDWLKDEHVIQAGPAREDAQEFCSSYGAYSGSAGRRLAPPCRPPPEEGLPRPDTTTRGQAERKQKKTLVTL